MRDSRSRSLAAAAARAPEPPPGRAARAWTAFALAAATVAAFAGVRGNAWLILDDPAYVTAEPHVRAGLTADGVRWAFTQPHGGNWHPLTSLSHMLDVQCFGLAPMPPHVENLAWHVLAALLLLVALDRLTGSWWRSAAVAALFALHPLRAESVAWVAERKDVLSGCAFMLVLIAYASWARRPRAASALAVAGATALGLLAKPMLVSVPFVLLALDAWPLGRLSRATLGRRVREKWPLFVLALAVMVLTVVFQHATGAVTGLAAFPLPARAANAALACWRYVGASFWPVRLAVTHPFPDVLPLARVALAAVALAAATSLAWRLRARAPWLLTGWAWMLVMLLPVIGIVQVGPQGWADRYSYLPTIGLAIALVWSVAGAAERARWPRALPAGLAVAACAALAVATFRQVRTWRDSESLFRQAVAAEPRSYVAHNGLAHALVTQGRTAEAVVEFDAGLRLAPDDLVAREDLASALVRLGRWEEAREQFVTLLRADETAPGWFDLGLADLRLGRAGEAARALERSLALAPGHAPTHALLAEALLALGRPDDARAHLRRAAELDPERYGAAPRAGH